MKQLHEKDIFDWFKSQSGAKRIELMCGLIAECIPLEVRFFDTIIQDYVKKEYNSFRDAEIKSNSYQELDLVCKCDLLFEKINTGGDTFFDDATSAEMNGNGPSTAINNVTSSSNNGANKTANSNTNAANSNDGQATNSNTNVNNNSREKQQGPPETTTISHIHLSNFPSRSKLIISLCLMQPSNRACSLLVFNAIRRQISPQNVYNAVTQLYMPKNQNIEQLFSEILLLLTMAMYHPAFTYEQRDLLASQKKEIEHLFYTLLESFFRSQFIATQVQTLPLTPASGTGPSSTSSQSQAQAAGMITSSSGHQQQQQPPPPIYHQTNNPSGQAPATVNAVGQSHHTQPTHQYHHPYHQSGGGKPILPTVAAPPPQQQFPYAFSTTLQPPMANIMYATSPPQMTPNMNNPTANASIQNIAMLNVNSPQQQQSSSSPSPSISPSSGGPGAAATVASSKIPVVPTSATTNMASYTIYTAPTPPGALPPPPPNSLIPITVDGTPGGVTVQLMNIAAAPNVPVLDDHMSSKSSVSSTTLVSSPASCYNCGNMGHRGNECTSVGNSAAAAAAGCDDNH